MVHKGKYFDGQCARSRLEMELEVVTIVVEMHMLNASHRKCFKKAVELEKEKRDSA
jgi:hypothetical protein